jgi:hypothetical protein
MSDFYYEPMSEEQALKARYQMLDDGIYKAVIEHAEGKPSSKGNPMAVLTMRVWSKDGTPKELMDYLPMIPSMIWKARHLCEALGMIKEFEAKSWKPEMAVGKDLLVQIKTQGAREIPFDKLNGKAPGAMYPAKNIIEDYIASREDKGMKPLPKEEKLFDEEDPLPF